MIAWYGVPGKYNPDCKTHVVINGSPVCGSKPHGEAQFCSNKNHVYVAECKHCKKWQDKNGK